MNFSLPSYDTRYFSLQAFLQGLGGVIFILVALALWASLRADATAQRGQDRLASKTVLIEKAQKQAIDEEITIIQRSDSLLQAPMEGLYVEGEYGYLPKKRDRDGLSPFDAYKKPFDAVPGRAKVALVFMDLGLSKNTSKAVYKHFPALTSFSFSPYSKQLSDKIALARAQGYETWLQFPLETEDFENHDLGPQSILRSVSVEQNLGRLEWLLSQAPGYTGLIFPENHIFKDDSTDIQKILEQIFNRGLGVAEMSTEGSSDIGIMAFESNGRYGVGTTIIGDKKQSREISADLKKLETVALKEGFAIGYIYSSSLTLTMLKKWADGLDERGLQLAPLSAVLP